MEFIIFGPLHQLVFLTLIIGLILVFIFRSNKYTRYILASVLIAQIIAFNVKHISSGTYSIQNYLPLHLCTLSAIIAPIALLTKNKIFNILLLFWGLIPALLAIVLPDMNRLENYTTFRFWEFFVSHVFIVLSTIYIAIHSNHNFALKKFETWKQVIISYFTLCLYAISIVIPINYLLGSNYLYLAGKASNGMGFLPDGALYLPAMFGMALLVFIIEAVIYSLILRFKKYNNKS